jgi:hypothetical protein
MTSRRTLFICARVCFGLFILLTSIYCLLAYIPLTRHSVIELALVSWLPIFVKFHSLIYWLTLSLLAITLLPDLRRPETKRLTRGFLCLHLLLGIFLLFHPVLSDLPTDERSFIWGLIAFFPVFWLAAIDYMGHHRELKETEKSEGRFTYLTFAASALFLSLLYVGVFYLRYVKQGIVQFKWTEMLIAVVWSIASHLLVCTFIFVILKLIRVVSGRFARPSKISFLLYNFLASIIGVMVFRKVIFAAISFNNYFADIFSIAVSLAGTAFISGLCLRMRGFGANDSRQEINSIFKRLRDNQRSLLLARALLLAGVALFAYAVPASIASTDWNSLGQMLSVIPVWLLTCVLFRKISQGRQARQFSALVLLFIAVASFGAYRVLGASESRWPNILRDSKLDVGSLLERYANYDISFGFTRKLLSPAEGDPNDGMAENQVFFELLRHNTNLSTEVAPVTVNLVSELKPTSKKKPNIFIFVIDSLRQDYISPYNNRVNFTPSIEAFARESVVMKNAFTRYGGTALSEPSIWVGGMQLHKLYIEPFYPLNALQKLIETNGYESFITLDPILQKIVKPSPNIVQLDQGTDWKRLDLCHTLQELEQKIDERSDPQRPIFAYTQPENVHLVSLKTSGYTVPPDEHYEGFDAEHASQIKRIDKSFGEFIQYLKARNLYDNSIVILTADHGDSLGEEGRWGHAAAIFPEVMRIPLLIHLPTEFQKSMTWDAGQVSFLTDITPTLYYLLDNAPIIPNPIYGRPLFTATPEEQRQYKRDSYLIVSSYGAVYGILHDNGRSLFIADALSEKEYFYNLADDPNGTRNRLNADIRAQDEELIRKNIEAINAFYKFTPPQN